MVKKEREELDLFTRPIFNKLFGPALLSALGLAFADMADAIVVGGKMQAEGLAAIGLILPVYMFDAVFANGFGIGGSVKYAKLLSQGLKVEARDHFYSTVFTSIVFGIITCILGTIFINPLLSLLGTNPGDGILFTYTKDYLQILLIASPFYQLFYILNYYLRNDNNEKIASIASISGNILDISLSILFVIVLNMGTRGAALATLIGYIITTCIYWYGIRFKSEILGRVNTELKVKSYFFRLSKDFYKSGIESLRNGISTSISYIYSLIFILLCNNILINMAGDVGVAAFDLVQNCSYLIYYLYEASAKSMQPLITTYVGENNSKGRENVIRYGAAYGGLIGFVAIIVIELWPEIICSLFGVNPFAEGDVALRLFCIGAFFGGYNLLICNYYQSCDANKPVILIETLRGAGILLPSAIIFSNFGIDKFWLLYPTTEILTFVIFLVVNNIKKFEIPTEKDERVYSATVLASAESLVDISQEIGEFCEKWEANPKKQYMITLTVEEIGMAILLNGIKGQSNGYIQFTLIAKEDGEFRLHVRDNASSFNPFSMKLRDNEDGEMNLDALGIETVKKSSNLFSYRQFNGYNTLVIYL